MARFATSQFSVALEVTIGKKTVVIEIASCDMTFGLNNIPTAGCMLSVGRNARDVKQLASIHKYANEMRIIQKARILFKPLGQWEPDGDDWPDGVVAIFDGYLTGTSYVKQQGKTYFTANLTHWLSDLNFASTMNGESHPAGAAHLAHAGVYDSTFQTFDSQPSMIGGIIASEHFTEDTIKKDLWGLAIKPFLKDLATYTNSILSMEGQTVGCLNETDGKNEQALAALKRIEGGEVKGGGKVNKDGTIEKGVEVKYTYGVPLALTQDADGMYVHLAYGIEAAVRSDSLASYWGTTMWDKLVGDFASSLMFSVVPLVETALIVPFMPGLQSIYNKAIRADEYEVVESDCSISRPLKAVGIHVGSQSATFGQNDKQGKDVTSIIGFGGCFKPQNADPKGMILLKAPPGWLANVMHSAGDVIVTALDESGIGGKTKVSPNEVGGLMGDTLNRYAQAMYMFEVLRGRTAVVRGKLRFDISPGSNIAIQNTFDPAIGAKDSLNRNIIGSVLRVSIHINAEAAQAGTAFQLGYVRTVDENEDERTSIDNHPFYADRFLGAPLVGEYQFPVPRSADGKKPAQRAPAVRRGRPSKPEVIPDNFDFDPNLV